MPHVRGVAAVLVLSLGAAQAVSAVWRPAPPPGATALPADILPRTLAGYTSAGDRPPAPEVQRALPGADFHERDYRDGADTMDFLLIGGAHGVALHDPRLCLGALLLSAPHAERLPGTPVTMQIYNASSHPGQAPDMQVAYFYVENGRVIASPSQIRMSLFWGDLLGRPGAPVYFFRFIQPLAPDADARLQSFAAGAWQALRPHLGTVAPR